MLQIHTDVNQGKPKLDDRFKTLDKIQNKLTKIQQKTLADQLAIWQKAKQERDTKNTQIQEQGLGISNWIKRGKTETLSQFKQRVLNELFFLTIIKKQNKQLDILLNQPKTGGASKTKCHHHHHHTKASSNYTRKNQYKKNDYFVQEEFITF